MLILQCIKLLRGRNSHDIDSCFLEQNTLILLTIYLMIDTKALRRIVGVRWYAYVRSASILTSTGQCPLTTIIRKLRLGTFGHICRLQPSTQTIDILASTPPSSWLRPRGRPPLRWADQVTKDTQMSLSDAVIATHDRPSWRSLVRDATCPATQAT